MTDGPRVHARTSTTGRERGVDSTISRSLRVSTALWEDAQAKASQDAVRMNRVIAALVEGYARGVHTLPATTSVTVTKSSPPQPVV